jgi:hypothetical protein
MQAKDLRVGELYTFGYLITKTERNARQNGYEPYVSLVFELNGVYTEYNVECDDVIPTEPPSAQNHRRS